MLQRIQTVYLLLTAVCAMLCLCLPVGHFHQAGLPVADLYNLWLAPAGAARDFAPWALFPLLLLTAVSSLVAVFLYRRRMLQVRLTVFGGLLLIGYYAVLTLFVFRFRAALDADFTISWTAAFPAVGLILEYLAFRGIMKDELIVRSLDRLR